jgi:predicted transcriptional regulator of viral defense system
LYSLRLRFGRRLLSDPPLAKTTGVLRAKDLNEHGITRAHLSRMVEQGLLQAVARGLYRLPNAPLTEHHSLVETAVRVPNGIICLLSALNFHGLTTQLPFEVWLAIEYKAWAVQEEQLPLRFVRFSGDAFTAGVEYHTIEGAPVKIYGPAKTVADCFKYRHKIGLDIALEAMRDGLRQRLFTVDNLWRYAGICRAQNVMRPYLEALL